jgi:hypothetical protein
MVITMSAVPLNTLLAFVLVLGFGPFPKLGVVGAGVATLISQALRCVALLVVLYSRKEGMRWYWPFGSRLKAPRVSPYRTMFPSLRDWLFCSLSRRASAGAGSIGQQVRLTFGREKPTRCDSLSRRRISAESRTVRLEHQLTRQLNRLEPCFVHRR